MSSSPAIDIHPIAYGRITPQALLSSQGTVELTITKEAFASDICVFHVATDGFWFGLGFLNGHLVIQRNEYVLKIGPSFMNKLKGNDVILASWTLDSLNFLLGPVGFPGPSFTRSCNMKPCPAPLSLFNWARQQSLIPATQFVSESEFLGRVHSALDLLQEKIDQMPNRNVFWDIEYKGNKIVKKTPKKEVDLHPVIRGLLSDQMFLSSIELSTEYHTGIGDLDFLFIGNVRDIGQVKICAEFKHAHSTDLINGIERQLPAYMHNQKTDHGTYCILDFRSEWFNKPAIETPALYAELAQASRRANLPVTHPIKVHHIKLGKLVPASRLT